MNWMLIISLVQAVSTAVFVAVIAFKASREESPDPDVAQDVSS